VNKSLTKFKVSTFVILYLEMCDGMSGAEAVHSNCWSVRQRLVGVFEMKASESAAKPMKWSCVKRRLQKFMMEGC